MDNSRLSAELTCEAVGADPGSNTIITPFNIRVRGIKCDCNQKYP